MGVSPFHEGERAVQARAGAKDVARFASGFVHDHLPDQHRAFHAGLPFLVVAGRDGDGRVWASVLDGPAGFVAVPHPGRVRIAAPPGEGDPLHGALDGGAPIGILGIELATRRRNRVNGRVARDGDALVVDVQQAFGNCPQYIRPRPVERVERSSAPGPVHRTPALTEDQIARVRRADTFFVATGHPGAEGAAQGMDASHRGGEPGFVSVAEDGASLRFPDYAGNDFFNTLGNLERDPRAGLLFVDFAAGGLLHLTGTITVDWTADEAAGARRHLDMAIEAVIDRPGALSLRWGDASSALRRLRLVERRAESIDVASFTFAAEDGTRLPAFRPGQHLPIRVRRVGASALERSYSLSGAPGAGRYRISVKRAERGVVSRLLHDEMEEGAAIEVLPPAGDFAASDEAAPLVLVSAGIGVTPMVSHLHAEAARPGDRRVWFVHGARDGARHALAREVRALVASSPKLSLRVAYSAPRDGDVEGRDFDWRGRITPERILKLVAAEDAQYLLCGPPAFVSGLAEGLRVGGVDPGRIRSETF